MFLKYFSKV